MCDNVIVHREDGTRVECETLFDLHFQMSNGIYIKDDPDVVIYKELDKMAIDKNVTHDFKIGEVCLCIVDIDKTAFANGYKSTRELADGSHDEFNVHFWSMKNG